MKWCCEGPGEDPRGEGGQAGRSALGGGRLQRVKPRGRRHLGCRTGMVGQTTCAPSLTSFCSTSFPKLTWLLSPSRRLTCIVTAVGSLILGLVTGFGDGSKGKALGALLCPGDHLPSVGLEALGATCYSCHPQPPAVSYTLLTPLWMVPLSSLPQKIPTGRATCFLAPRGPTGKQLLTSPADFSAGSVGGRQVRWYSGRG